MTEKKSQNRSLLLSAKSLIVPAVLLILLMHALLVWNTVRINRASQLLSDSIQRNLSCAELCSDFSRASDALNTRATDYILAGRSSTLEDYFAQRQTVWDSADELTQLLEETDLSGERVWINQALSAVEERGLVELRAMRLGAHALEKDLGDFPELAAVALTEEELTLRPWQLREQANALLNTGRYDSLRSNIQSSLSRLEGSLSRVTGDEVEMRSAVIRRFQALQWVLIGVVIGVLFLMAALLFLLLLLPLEHSVALVKQGRAVSADTGFSELRQLAGAYDELLSARDALEADLRLASVTDALTGLQNRTAFQDYLNSLQDNLCREAVTVFSLDVNGLKTANDRQGHLFGDMLLCDAAHCILSTLGCGEGRSCYRCGGDEFTVIWVGVPEAEIAPALAGFHEEQRRRGVSVSEGWARTEDLGTTTMRRLFEEADQRMYENKAERKRAAGAVVNNE